ncbi:EF-hand calcium-binding domain-containing protein 11-like [Mytilus californianus]|uniref:EF-hand calcium-binding domain-containing protein 11-like n=1 Tax=Mytilus californianus TaxID=6549 RepID=UPI002245C7DB|nr:EF-hand calcium-binding domain-containing protein 11-like [Mytilus californianus]
MSCSLNFNLKEYGYQNFPRSLTKKDKQLLSSVFHEADDGNKGFLTREDVKMAVAEIFGYKPSKLETDQVILKFGEDIYGSRCMKLAKFLDAMSEKLMKSDEDEDIRHTFMAFDSQCRGFLTVEDFKKAVGHVAPHLPMHAVELSFRELDRDGDGRVSYKDFEFMMKYNLAEHI